MARWHHWCNGHELGQTSGDGEGQGGLVCSSPRGCKELDMTERLNSNYPSLQNKGSIKRENDLLKRKWKQYLFLVWTNRLTNVTTTGSVVKIPPAIWETQAWSLGWEDPLEKQMETHSSILAWRIQWTEEPGGPQPMTLQRVRRDWATNTLTFYVSGDFRHLFWLSVCSSRK